MSAFGVITSVFILFVISGFCIDGAPVSADAAAPPVPDKSQVQFNASVRPTSASENDGKSKQVTDEGSKTAPQQLTAKIVDSNPTPKNESGASSANGGSDTSQTKAASPVGDAETGAIATTKTKTSVQTDAVKTETANGSATSKSNNTPKATNPSGQATVVDDKTAGNKTSKNGAQNTGKTSNADSKDLDEAKTAGKNTPKIQAQDAGKPSNAGAKASATDVKKADKKEEEVESVGQAPAPKPGGNGDDSADGQSKNVKDGPGIEAIEDGADDVGESEKPPKDAKAVKVDQDVNRKDSAVAPEETPPKMGYDDEPENSHFLAYLLTIGVLCVAAYVVAHNRHKIMGLVLEGRQGRRSGRSGSTSGRGVKYKRLQHEDAEGENGVSLSSRDGGRVIY